MKDGLGAEQIIPRSSAFEILQTVLIPIVVIWFRITNSDSPEAKRLRNDTRARYRTIKEDAPQATVFTPNCPRLPPPLTLQHRILCSEPHGVNANAGHGGVDAVLCYSVAHRWEATALRRTVGHGCRVGEWASSVPLVLDGVGRNSEAD